MSNPKAGLAVFGTSAAVLVLEILAGRLMAPYVGVSLETFTGIIGTVLAAIAVGAAAGGWLADRYEPRRLIGPSLVLGGALAWASLPIVSTVGPAVDADPSQIVFLAALAFFAPAAVLSAVSPMTAKLRLRDLDETGSVVGGLSAAGTAGALVGTFLTGFVLVAALPSRPIVLGVGAALVLAGVAARWWLERRPPAVVPLAAALVVGLVGVATPSPCELETAYFCVRVEVDPDRPTGRALHLDQLRHAYVDLADPTYLEFRYVRLLDDVATALAPGPLDVLHVGGGGFTFPRYLSAVRPGSQHLVLEIDPELVEVARDELGLTPRDDLEIRTGDARLALDDLPDDAYDLVVGDAFASESVPWHLTTAEVVDELARVLQPGGVYAMNVIDGGDSAFARAQLATLAEAFEHVAVIVPPGGVPEDRAVNQILIASDRPLPNIEVDPADGELVDGVDVAAYVDGARPLTDDFAPVDNLVF